MWMLLLCLLRTADVLGLNAHDDILTSCIALLCFLLCVRVSVCDACVYELLLLRLLLLLLHVHLELSAMLVCVHMGGSVWTLGRLAAHRGQGLGRGGTRVRLLRIGRVARVHSRSVTRVRRLAAFVCVVVWAL